MLINGRTPEEIITGLKCEVPCSKCAYREHNFMKDDSCSYYVEQDILALIKHLEAQQPKWISVEERLPEDAIPDDKKMTRYKAIKVLVAIKGSNGVTTIRTQTRFKDYSYKSGKEYLEWSWRESGGKVTHWMPMPQPPEEEE